MNPYTIVTILAAATILPGQSERQTVRIVVHDVVDYPVQSAKARLISVDRAFPAEANLAGNLQFNGVTPATYDLEVRADGFAAKIYRDVHFPTGDSKPFEVVVSVGNPGDSCGFVNTVSYRALTAGTAMLSGIIVDEDSGRGPLGVSIKLTNAVTGFKVASVNSGQHGAFGFSDVPPGRYNAQVTKVGYKPEELRDFLVPRGNSTLLNFKIDTQRQMHVCQ